MRYWVGNGASMKTAASRIASTPRVRVRVRVKEFRVRVRLR